MKLKWRIFLVTYLVLIVAYGIFTSVIMSSWLDSMKSAEVNSVIQQNTNTAKLFHAYYLVNPTTSDFDSYFEKFKSFTNFNDMYTELSTGDKYLYVSFYGAEFSGIMSNTQQVAVYNAGTPNQIYVTAVTNISEMGQNIFIETTKYISPIFTEYSNHVKKIQIWSAAILAVSTVFILITVHFISKPLNKLTSLSAKIAKGDITERIKLNRFEKSIKEIDMLADSFNNMAECNEKYISQLKEEYKKQEEFTGSFTHELKTPLTTIIGYSDLLRTYDLPQNERRMYAEYIYKEGKRLESLSIHLLNLLVMNNQSFTLSEVKTEVLAYDLKSATAFLPQKYGVSLDFYLEKDSVICEPSLLKTLIINLMDNGCKASEKGSRVTVVGKREQGFYVIQVIDHGMGIPEDEIKKITEPFYMVDKSRARKQGGTGLGLALCSKIALIHGTSLEITSQLRKGTTVSFKLKRAETSNETGAKNDEA